MTTYFEMGDAVNDAKTEDARRYAEARLSGWIECADAAGIRWSGIDADNYTIAKHGDLPMCCGVLLGPNVEVEAPLTARKGTK